MNQNEQAKRVREQEFSLHRADIRASRKQLDQLIADDFMEFGSSGQIFDKRQIIDALAEENRNYSDAPSVSAFATRFLSDTVALVTYRAAGTGPRSETLRCSIWRLEDRRWRMTFHQGTPAARPGD